MKGIFLKDIMNMKQQCKVYLLMIAVWLVIGITGKNPAFFGGVMMMFTILIPISAAAYDDRAGWEKYALTMPVSRRNLALSKYMLALLSAVVGTALSFTVNLIMGEGIMQNLMVSAVFFMTGLAFVSIVLPLVFKFGVEKGRMLMTAVIVIPAFLGGIIIKFLQGIFSEKLLILLAKCLPVLDILLIAGSMYISCRIYEKKEF